jgi:hypothetical protein
VSSSYMYSGTTFFSRCVESCEATGSHFCDHMVVGHKYQVFACSLWEGRIAPSVAPSALRIILHLELSCTHLIFKWSSDGIKYALNERSEKSAI